VNCWGAEDRWGATNDGFDNADDGRDRLAGALKELTGQQFLVQVEAPVTAAPSSRPMLKRPGVGMDPGTGLPRESSGLRGKRRKRGRKREPGRRRDQWGMDEIRQTR
jgi:hypothetical protein